MYRTKINYKKFVATDLLFLSIFNSIFDAPVCYEKKQIIKSLT